MKALKIFSSITALAVLAACGGGDSNAPSTVISFDNTAYIGNYVYSDISCNRFDYNSTQYAKRMSFVISANAVAYTESVYNDSACTVLAGTLVITDNLSWSAGTIGGASIAYIQATFNSFKVSPTNASSTVTLTSLPSATTEDQKSILKLIGTSLYSQAHDSPVDANGYATSFEATPFAIKQ
jgi:hypothetical protein